MDKVVYGDQYHARSMSKVKKIKAVAYAALILTFWNAFSWTVLPFHGQSLTNLDEQLMPIKTMQEKMTGGVYHYPGLPADNTGPGWSAIEEKSQRGPRVTLMVYHPEGSPVFDVGSLALSVVFNILAGLLIATLVDTGKSWPSTFVKVISMGGIACLAKTLPFLVWYKFPFSFIILEIVDIAVGFSLVGILLGLMHRTTQTNSNH